MSSQNILMDSIGYRYKCQGLTLENCISIISNLPDHYLYFRCKLQTDWSTQTEFGKYLSVLRNSYIAKADWLSYLLLGRTDLELELKITEKAHYKSLADETVAFYLLIKEVWARVDFGAYIPSPEYWLLEIEIEMLTNMLMRSGILGEADRFGKKEMYGEVKDWADSVSEVSNLKPNGTKTSSGYYETLIASAFDLALNEKGFEEEHYLPFLRRLKRSYRDRERAAVYGFYLNENGDLQMIYRGKRSNKKGFGKKVSGKANKNVSAN
jgi:hypothetical protein